MSQPPAFQLYAADFYMDTISWTNEEIGIYFRLLMCEWVNGPLPFEAKKLQKISQIGVKKWHKRWQIVGEKFKLNGDGKLINERLERVREEQLVYLQSQSESGKRGVEAKKKRGIYPFNKSSDPSSTASSDPSSDPATQNQALQSSSSYKKEKDIQTLQFVLGDSSKYELGIEKIKQYGNTYPNIDLMQCLRECAQWNIDNPDRRKTKKGILKHINTWLQKAQKDKRYITPGLELPEVEQDTRTPEKQKADMDKFRSFLGGMKLKTMD